MFCRSCLECRKRRFPESLRAPPSSLRACSWKTCPLLHSHSPIVRNLPPRPPRHGQARSGGPPRRLLQRGIGALRPELPVKQSGGDSAEQAGIIVGIKSRNLPCVAQKKPANLSTSDPRRLPRRSLTALCYPLKCPPPTPSSFFFLYMIAVSTSQDRKSN